MSDRDVIEAANRVPEIRVARHLHDGGARSRKDAVLRNRDRSQSNGLDKDRGGVHVSPIAEVSGDCVRQPRQGATDSGLDRAFGETETVSDLPICEPTEVGEQNYFEFARG